MEKTLPSGSAVPMYPGKSFIPGVMKKVCARGELRVRNPHDLRHTYATIMLMAHQSPAYVQQQLGHSSITTTVDVYGHWIQGEGRKNLEEALMGTVPNEGENRIFSHIGKTEGL
ncbi:MAG: tyrosine-type recombinase/integrase [Proteobacteria bacterium]|nr:tyrosine-type recombinase/integrase [Pseudomonadota bacterium]MBU1709706.1 tyrosine-type recombinase/integrase [Pseudomonadota bacterium]